ncbi:unnamed protein product [Ambrosiozyma monospora]|uniref:Unnamed protein product n=1 Tax=Ambrosiozyma monospora TaxID=43982 RepID=A0ACB5SU11_AMBMO|nr:unnamed protein product [Ambrosiozyma monospora]
MDEGFPILKVCSREQLQELISQLPACLKKLSIEDCQKFGKSKFVDCCPDKLAFEHFKHLESLRISCPYITQCFDVSIIPVVDSLDFDGFPLFIGCFPSGIKSIKVNLTRYKLSLSYFLNHFISKLSSLMSFSVIINAPADIRNVKFPAQLFSLEIIIRRSTNTSHNEPLKTDPSKNQFGRLVLSCLPSSLAYFTLHVIEKQEVVVDDCQGETIYSMKQRIHVVSGKVTLDQYISKDNCLGSSLDWYNA